MDYDGGGRGTISNHGVLVMLNVKADQVRSRVRKHVKVTRDGYVQISFAALQTLGRMRIGCMLTCSKCGMSLRSCMAFVQPRCTCGQTTAASSTSVKQHLHVQQHLTFPSISTSIRRGMVSLLWTATHPCGDVEQTITMHGTCRDSCCSL